jgi:ubiquinone/menaquinone biosynthesis C-methylase UbiE
MNDSDAWKQYWEKSPDVSDFEFDRGTSPRLAQIEALSGAELTEFVDPGNGEVVLDAGCGAGSNIFLLASKVRRMVAMDYAESAIVRCRRRLRRTDMAGVELIRGDIRQIPLPDDSVDKVICISVLQYLNDVDVREALQEFRRVTRSGGVVVLHVKNVLSLYLSTLLMAKRLKRLFGASAKQEHLRSSGWYMRHVTSAGMEIVAYNSFNVFMIERMPRWLLAYMQRIELTYYRKFPLRTRLLRRLGSDFKIKARVMKARTR